MEDDKWKVIDTHLNSMMDWTSGMSSNPPNSQAANQRHVHIHRRSEPDVDMIRKARMSRQNTVQLPVPQSAPVQPGTFQLDWNAMPKRNLASCEDEPTEDVGFMAETANMNQFPELAAFTASTQSENVTKSTVLNPLHHAGSSDPGQLISVHREPGFSSTETPPRPPPYPRVAVNGPVMQNSQYDPAGGSFHPCTLVSELPYNSNHVFSSIKGPPNSHFGYASPRTSRRSSVPVNQPDPRAHSASPNITRRSISTVQRRRTQDNYMYTPSSIMPNSDMNPVANHPSLSIGPTTHPSIYASKPPSEVITSFPTIYASKPPSEVITSFSTISSKKADDQEYTIVLLQHQRHRMQRLQKELEAKKKLLDTLSAIVTTKEREVFDKRSEKTSTSMPTLNDVTKLRELNRQMEIDCNCMIKEIDMVTKTGNSLDGNFYENILRKNPSGGCKKKHPANDLPSPPLPPPPVPPPTDNEDEPKWSCKWCTFLNHAALDKCEVCEYRREHVPVPV